MFTSKAEYLLLKVPFSIIKKQNKYCICYPWKIPENISDSLCGRKDVCEERCGAEKLYIAGERID